MFRKSLIAFGCLLLTYSQNIKDTQANEMKPLLSILQQEQSASMFVYAFERCSGLFNVLYARFSNYDKPQYKKIADIMLNEASVASIGALNSAKTAGLNLTMEKTIQKSLEMSKRYGALMDKHMQNTGNSISPFIEKDQSLCMELNKAIK